MVFTSLEKFDGISVRPLTVAEVKQIAGRAGRHASQYETGTVTCLRAVRLYACTASLQCHWRRGTDWHSQSPSEILGAEFHLPFNHAENMMTFFLECSVKRLCVLLLLVT